MRWRRSKALERRCGLLAAALVLGACAAGVEAPTGPAAADPDAAFVVDPLRGYPLGVGMEQRLQLSQAHEALVVRGDLVAGRTEARSLLERDPNLHPARLLLAQAHLLAGEDSAALDAARRITDEVGDYFAAQLLVSRAAEKVGDLALAYEGYFDLAERSAAAGGRADLLRPRVLEIVRNRVDDALRRGRTDEAGFEVARLARWAPGEPVTLFAARDLAAAIGDRVAELEALRRLEPQRPEDLTLRGDRADLELEVGDASVGLRIYQDLASAAPADARLAGKLARAQFLWRLTLLPEKVQTLARQPRLSKGQFAAVLYWLFPQVRYAQSESGTIATDVLDHELRQEIVRVVNLGLLPVDPTLHIFRPDEPQSRAAALTALLKLLARQEPRLACLGPARLAQPSTSEVCRLAAGCRLIGEAAECLPLAELSGPDAFEMSRGALGQLGIE